MKLLSINIGQKQTQQNGLKLEITGIYKNPANEPVEITALGIRQDFIASSKHHGGPDQAIYVYGQADYQWWSGELGREISAGTFGDNLTISELESAQFNIGDRLHMGSVILEVSAPRIPCKTFARRMADPLFVKKFRHAERPGLYCRVIREGIVQVDDEVTIEKYQEKYQGETISIIQMYRDFYAKRKSVETLRRHLNAPIAIRARVDLEKQLKALSG
jgi:MOSC domain-containing protein YiiM